MTKNKNNKNNNKRRRPIKNGQARVQHLPVLNTNVVVKHKYRFIATGAAATSQVITSNQLIGCAGVVGTVANSTVAFIFASVRLRHLEVWGGPAVSGLGSTVSVEWTGAANTPNLEFSDSTIVSTIPAHLRLSPPKNTLASFWQLSTASVNMFQITCPVGTIVDVTLDLILSDTGAAATTLAGFTTVVLNEVYYLALDARTPNTFIPVRLTTTT